MIRFHTRWWFYLFAGALVWLLFPSQPIYAHGSGVTIFGITQQDLNGDGRPDITIIDCAFATAHDRITVVDQGNDMQASAIWPDATDFRNDTWLYDIGADGTVQLVVVYRVEEGHATASIFDDQDGDGQVNYELSGTQVKILESPYWTARITANSDWFLPDGRVNLNVRVELDGPIPTFDRAPTVYIQNWLKHDGVTDAEFEEIADSDGVARYAVKRLLAPSPADWGFERTGLYSNEGHYPTHLPDRAFFPFLPIPLDPHDPRSVNVRYFDLPPDVNVDWLRGKVMAVELPGYPIGHGYHFNDNRYLLKGQVNDVAFESPQAYYDLANNHDAFAELHIRFFTHPPDDTTMFSLDNMAQVPWQSISYDWNLLNPGTLLWDFKVGLGGTYNINSVVQFRDFAVRTVPFEKLPRWITEREWKLTTFVAREGAGYQSSEGIYEWQTDTGDDPETNGNRAVEARDATFKYMFGVTSTPPDAYFTTSHPGFRAERHFASPIQPYLYFSPLDRKLHLRGAEDGIWTIDDQHLIRYANLDGDSYLDEWQYLANGAIQRQLINTGDYFVYTAGGDVLLKRAQAPPALFETLPPTDHDEWADLRAKLDTNKPAFAPSDFYAMIEQFNGPEVRIAGASVRDYRPVGNRGFRFVLDLRPGFQVQGADLLPVRGLKPGVYAVSYDGIWRIATLTPPVVSASVLDTTLTQLEPGAVQVALRNDGLEDLPQATLELWGTSPQGQATLVATQTVALLAQMPITPTLQWAPSTAGLWALTPKIRQSNNQLIVFAPVHVTILPAETVDAESVVAASTSPEYLLLAMVALVTSAAIAALILWWQRNTFREKQ